jgi:hypothetical protein
LLKGEITFVGFGMGGGTLIDAGTHPVVSLETHS